MGSVPQTTYTWSDHYVAEPKPIRIIAIGTGISGIAFVYKATGLENVDFVVYEKDKDIGGTWLESRYPGVSCDVPSHAYTYSWVGNPEWSKVYVGAEEIWNFYRKLAKEYGVYEKTKFQHKVVGAEWDHEASQWKVTIEDLTTGNIFVDRAEVVLNFGGVLNNWKWPAIPGLRSFEGKLVHSANWDHNLDLADKRVAVIGSGASGIQIVPTIQPVVKSLVSYNRSPNWVAGEFAAAVAWEGRSSTYTEEQKEKFRTNPQYFKEYRQDVEHAMNARFPLFYRYSEAQRLGVEAVTKSMKERLRNDPILTKSLIPEFPIGCRRVTPGAGYLEALIKDNVQVVTNPIEKVTEKGIISIDKKAGVAALHEFDVLITATGYDTSFIPRFPIIGLDGVNLQDKWRKEGASAYISVSIPNYPNYFLTLGPNTPISNGSLIPALELQIDYALAFVKKLQTQSLKYGVVRQDATEEFNEHKDVFMEQMSWSGNCTSWYKNGNADGKIIGPWPGSVSHFLEALAAPRFEDYEWKYQTGNRFQYLGNGKSSREAKGQPLNWYIK